MRMERKSFTSMRPSMSFEIQKIIGVTTDGGNVRNFQVQWAPTWVSDHHLVGCEELIEEFLGCDSSICEQQSTETSSCNNSMNMNMAVKEEVPDDAYNHISKDTGKELSISMAFERTSIDYVQTDDFNEENGCFSIQSDDYISEDDIRSSNNQFREYDDIVQISPLILASDEPLDKPIKVEVEESSPSENNVHLILKNSDIVSSFPLTPSTCESHSEGIGYNNQIPASTNTSLSGTETNLIHSCNNTIDANVVNINNSQTNKYKGFNSIRNSLISIGNQSKKKHAKENRKLNVDVKDFPSSSYKESNKRCQCKVCGKQFHNNSNMNRHMRSTHFGETRHECHVCGKKWYQKAQFMQHMKKHATAGGKLFFCDFCSKSFPTEMKLKKHICSQFMQHVKKHMGGKLFDCALCRKTFPSEISLKKHICSIKTSQNNNSQNLPSFDDNESTKTCNDKEYAAKTCNDNESTSKTGDYKGSTNKCIFCGKEFHNKSNMNRHIRCAHG